jgi:hypothetical protein
VIRRQQRLYLADSGHAVVQDPGDERRVGAAPA